MKSPLLRIVGVVLLSAAPLGCSSESGPAKSGSGTQTTGKPRVAFVTNNTAEFWTIAEAGTRKGAEDFGVEVLFRRPPTGTAAEQKEIIDDFVNQGVQAIAVSVNDADNQLGYLNRIADKVPLLTQDNDAPASKRLCYLGTDNYEAGKDVGRLVKKAMPDGGVVAIFVGHLVAPNAKQRRQGALDELAGVKDATGPMYGKYRLEGTYTDNTDEKRAKDNATDVLVKLANEPNICLVGLWGYNPPAILSAVRDKNLQGKVKIVGFDEYDQTLLAIKEGNIIGTVVQQPFEFGYQSVKLMSQLAKGDRSGVPRSGIIHVPHKVITKENVEPFHAHLNKLLGK